jgi:hypothetical protein
MKLTSPYFVNLGGGPDVCPEQWQFWDGTLQLLQGVRIFTG